MAARRKTERKERPAAPTSAAAMSGPRTAPALSNARWRPKAAPRLSGGAAAAIIVSRGAVRIPFPILSKNRIRATTGQTGARPIRGRATEESP